MEIMFICKKKILQISKRSNANITVVDPNPTQPEKEPSQQRESYKPQVADEIPIRSPKQHQTKGSAVKM